MDDILNQILCEIRDVKTEVKGIKEDVSTLKEDVSILKQDVKVLKQRVTNIEVIMENELKRDIKIVAENHLNLNEKLDTLKGIDKKVTQLKEDVDILKYIAKDNYYEITALKASRAKAIV